MNGISSSSDYSNPKINNSPGTSSKKDSKDLNEPSKISELAVNEVKTGSATKVKNSLSHPTESKELDVDAFVKNVIKDSKASIMDPIHNDKVVRVVEKIQKYLSYHFNQSQLVSIIDGFGSGNHKIQMENNEHKHIIFVFKSENEISSGIVDVGKKAFAKGGFGKVYNVHMIDTNESLVFKMSRKKLKSKDSEGNLIKMTHSEKLKAAETGSARGAEAKADLIGEFEIMHYIKENAESTTGLNCHAFSFLKYKNQVGMLVNKFDYDGLNFLRTNPSDAVVEFVMMQIYSGMQSMHNLKICHRDIKLENILVKQSDKNAPYYLEGALSDFGNACRIDLLFLKTPYPNLNDVLGSGTTCNTSDFLVNQIKDSLNELKELKAGTSEYKSEVEVIIDLVGSSDYVSYGILMYKLWTGARPPFQCFKENKLFQFDEGLKAKEKEEVIDYMKKRIYDSSPKLSEKSRLENANLVINTILLGLDMS